MPRTPVDTELQEIFAPMGSGAGGTAAVLMRPSTLQADLAKKLIEELPLENALVDVGVILARYLADSMEQHLLRPADFTGNPETSAELAKRFAKALQSSDTFTAAFDKALRMRG